MIFYLARPSVLKGYKFFRKPPIKRVKPNLVSKTIEIWFDAQPDDESFDFYKLEKVLPGFDMKIGDCWKIGTEEEAQEGYLTCFRWVIFDKDVKLEVQS